MSTGAVVSQVSSGGKLFTQQRTVTADGNVTKDPTLAVAKIGALTTRTSDSVGTLTMNASHGITTAARLDLYWSGGARYGIVVGTVSVNSVPITGGAGDVLPADETAITAMVPQLEAFPVNTADLQGLFVSCTSPAWAVFVDDVDALVKAIYVESATDAYLWDIEQVTSIEAVNPFSLGDVASVYLSHGSSAAARQVSAVALVN